MKINMSYFRLAMIMTIIGLNSCSQELDIVADSGYSPVVYCILDPSDSVHYLRIGKSYLAYGDARENPPDSDSLVYHENFYAYLVENINGISGDLHYFEPASERLRDSGFFNTDNLELMKVNCQLNPGSEYSLYIYSPELPDLIVGSTRVIHSVRILDPVFYPGREITILPDMGYTMRWTNESKYAVYQPVLRVHYREGDSEFQTHNSVEFQLPYVSSVSNAAILVDFINGENFYKYFLDHLGSPPAGSQRKIIGFDLEICAGGEELNLFVLQERELGTPAGGVGAYTNLDGAAGVFASRAYSGSYNNRFSDITINFLANSDKTKHLGFLAFGKDF